MLKRGRIPVVALGFIALLALLYVGLALSRESCMNRDRRVAYTAQEIGRGNYYAWGQMFIWCERLTSQEKLLLKEACLEYSRSNEFLHVPPQTWPPAQLSQPLSPTLEWMRSIVGLDVDNLRYSTVKLWTLKDFPVSTYEPMFRSPGPRAWNPVSHGALAIRSSADPGQ